MGPHDIEAEANWRLVTEGLVAEELVPVAGELVATAPVVEAPGVRPAAPWRPVPISLATMKVTMVGAACALAIVGVAVGDARARSERIARAAFVMPFVVPPPPVAAPPVAAPPATPSGPSPSQADPPFPKSPQASQGIRTTPTVRALGLPTVNGALPAEVVSRIVRQNHGRIKQCYDVGLRGHPGLTGRVAVRFVIDRSGAVSTAAGSSESTLPDQAVTACIVRSFTSLSFPQPDNGIATVIYRVALTAE